MLRRQMTAAAREKLSLSLFIGADGGDRVIHNCNPVTG